MLHPRLQSIGRFLIRMQNHLGFALGFVLYVVALVLSHRLQIPLKIANGNAGDSIFAEIALEIGLAVAFVAWSLWWVMRSLKSVHAVQGNKNTLLAMLAHDLRSSISVIFGFSDLLRCNAEGWSSEQTRQMAEKIMACSRKLLVFQENLLCWSRIDCGRSCVQPQTVDVAEAVGEQFMMLSERALAKDLRLEHRIPEDLRVRADKTMFGLVLNNLISNAVKFTPEGGRIRLFSREVPGRVSLHVEDNGMGMSAEQVASLFEMSQANSTPGTAGESGFGLGLILCKELVHLNGGEIEVQSQPGAGTTFIVHLPAPRGRKPALAKERKQTREEAASRGVWKTI